jgi:hypothetical protein
MVEERKEELYIVSHESHSLPLSVFTGRAVSRDIALRGGNYLGPSGSVCRCLGWVLSPLTFNTTIKDPRVGLCAMSINCSEERSPRRTTQRKRGHKAGMGAMYRVFVSKIVGVSTSVGRLWRYWFLPAIGPACWRESGVKRW